MLSLRIFCYLADVLEVLNLKVLHYSLQRHAWVWTHLFHLPPHPSLFLPLFLLSCLFAEAHPLYRKKEKKTQREGKISIHEASQWGWQSTSKLLHHNFFIMCCTVPYSYVYQYGGKKISYCCLLNVAWFCGIRQTCLEVLGMI